MWPKNGVAGGGAAFAAALAALLAMLAMLVVIGGRWAGDESAGSDHPRGGGRAFRLAESALDRGYWKLMESRGNWLATSTGTIAGYSFDRTYASIEGGEYSVRISPLQEDQHKRVVEGVGRDSSSGEVRRLKAVYVNTCPCSVKGLPEAVSLTRESWAEEAGGWPSGL